MGELRFFFLSALTPLQLVRSCSWVQWELIKGGGGWLNSSDRRNHRRAPSVLQWGSTRKWTLNHSNLVGDGRWEVVEEVVGDKW
ncbi:hypothetical protein ACFX1Q_031428 [Malus domestica]